MKALHIFNAVMLALALTFATTLGVVYLIYAFYLDAAPRMREEWAQLGRVTALFAALGMLAAAAFVGQRRGSAWRWPAQGVLLGALLVGGFWLLQILKK